jgi:hypothetical protein
MTKKSRNWLILLLLIPTAVILTIAGLLIFQELQPLPSIQPLPNPNGYDDLVKAGEMMAIDVGNYDKMNQAELRELVAKNAGALSLARTSSSNECRVPFQFSQTYVENHIHDLVNLRNLAHAFVAEGKLAEMENRLNDATKSYLDTVRLGNEAGRGGVLIDEMVGLAIGSIGTGHLQKMVDQLDAKSCREAAATLETLDAQRQSWSDILQQEHAWSRRTFTSLRYRIYRPLLAKMAGKAYNKAEQKFKEQQTKTHQLTIDLAARAYELDKGHHPASPADLVPDYLKAIPQDPLTGTNLVYSPR